MMDNNNYDDMKDGKECYPFYYFTAEYDKISRNFIVGICSVFLCLTSIMVVFIHTVKTTTVMGTTIYMAIVFLSLVAIFVLSYSIELWITHMQYTAIEGKLARWMKEDGIYPEREKLLHKSKNTYAVTGNRGELEITGKNKKFLDGTIFMVDISGRNDFPYRLGCTREMSKIIRVRRTIAVLCVGICFMMGPMILYLDRLSMIKL